MFTILALAVILTICGGGAIGIAVLMQTFARDGGRAERHAPNAGV